MCISLCVFFFIYSFILLILSVLIFDSRLLAISHWSIFTYNTALKFLPDNFNISVIFSLVIMKIWKLFIVPYMKKYVWFFICQVIFVLLCSFWILHLWDKGSYLYSMRMLNFFFFFSFLLTVFPLLVQFSKPLQCFHFYPAYVCGQWSVWDLMRNLFLYHTS